MGLLRPIARASDHKVVLHFDEAGLVARLECPEGGGCRGGPLSCGLCGADLNDPEGSRCYDCQDMSGEECWVKTWFDNLAADELLHGKITVTIDPQWNGDTMEAHIR